MHHIININNCKYYFKCYAECGISAENEGDSLNNAGDCLSLKDEKNE